MTSERTSPPRGPVASQLKSLSPEESASLSAARAEGAAPVQDRTRDRSTSAGVNLWSKRFFIFNTTIFKFYELRGGGPAELRGYYPYRLRLCKARAPSAPGNVGCPDNFGRCTNCAVSARVNCLTVKRERAALLKSKRRPLSFQPRAP